MPKQRLLALGLALAGLLLGGCATVTISPTSSRTYDQAMATAETVLAGDSSLRAVQVSNTGSMRPYLGEASIVVLEPAAKEGLKRGNLASYLDGGIEKIHRVSKIAEDGFYTQTTRGFRREFVPWENLTGRSCAVFYFDPATLPATLEEARMPVAYTASTGELPPGPVLEVVGAQMVTQGQVADLLSLGRGDYTLSLPAGAVIRLFVGAAGTPVDRAASVDVGWDVLGAETQVKISDPTNPSLGLVNLAITAR